MRSKAPMGVKAMREKAEAQEVPCGKGMEGYGNKWQGRTTSMELWDMEMDGGIKNRTVRKYTDLG